MQGSNSSGSELPLPPDEVNLWVESREFPGWPVEQLPGYAHAMFPQIELPPPVNHVFVDCQNVGVLDPDLVGTKQVSFTLLLGANQTKLDVTLVEKLLANAASVQLIRLNSEGKNALDFALAYYLGQAVTLDPAGYFHVISKDKGYDPLIEHLRSRHVRVYRHDDITTLTFSHPAKATAKLIETPAIDWTERVVEFLRKNKNRPKKLTTLTSHLSAFCKTSTSQQVDDLIKKLVTAKQIQVTANGSVSYSI